MLDTSIVEIKADKVHHPDPGETPLTGAGVVVGVIDHGLDFTLDDFRDQAGATRVAFLWDQSLDPKGNERSPERFSYGVEYDADDINQALQSADPFALVQHEPKPAAHGTHVAGIAAGNGRASDAIFQAGRFIGVAPEATIIFVEPAANDVDGSFTDSPHVAEAITYIFQKATELGMPCVINMSLGQSGGSHDGESVVERAIDRLLEQRGRAFVVAAGNEHSWHGHASGTLRTGERRTLAWRVGGGLSLPSGETTGPGQGDRTPNELEVWYPSRDQLHLTLTSPDGESTPTVAPGETRPHTFANGNQAFITSEQFSELNGDARIYIEVSPGSVGQVQNGSWQVDLLAERSRDGRFDAWIERDRRVNTNKFADQSFLADGDFDPIMTLATPATTRRGVAVANYDHVANAPSGSSGRGPTRDGRRKPEIAAPGTRIRSSGALGGRVVGSTAGREPEPVRVVKTGTSMSAPHVAGVVALMLEKQPRLTATQIREMLIAAASPPAGVNTFDNAWGFGRLDAVAVIQLVQ
jgi:subtilisin family serine protease